MPNRILKDSICMSESIDNLSPEAEVLFYRIIVQCDDFGRMDARPSVIRAKCYPLKIDVIKDDYICNLIHELLQNQMIEIYSVQDKYFIQIPSWNKHQQIRAKKSKYPNPETTLSNTQSLALFPYHLISDDCNSNLCQVKSDDCNSPRNPIQSNPIRNTNRNTIPETKVSEKVISLTEKLIMLMKDNDPKVKVPENLTGWYLEMDRLLRLDQRTPEEIEQVIIWCQNDNFWKTNILSTTKLRKQFSQLYLKMKNNGHKELNSGNNGGNSENNLPTIADKTERLIKSWAEN